MNAVAILGRLTADPELKSTQSGVNVCQFNVAVNRKYKQNGERQADFIPCVAWRQTAEFVAKYFGKGRMIGVEGELQTRSFEDKNGNKRFVMEVVVSSASFAGDKQDASSSPVAGFEEVTDDNDLPF